MVKLFVGSSWLFLFCYSTMVECVTKGVGNDSGDQKWDEKGVGG